MRIYKSHNGYTGAQLLGILENDGGLTIKGIYYDLLPFHFPFANRAEICDAEEATHISIQSRWMATGRLIKI